MEYLPFLAKLFKRKFWLFDEMRNEIETIAIKIILYFLFIGLTFINIDDVNDDFGRTRKRKVWRRYQKVNSFHCDNN